MGDLEFLPFGVEPSVQLVYGSVECPVCSVRSSKDGELVQRGIDSAFIFLHDIIHWFGANATFLITFQALFFFKKIKLFIGKRSFMESGVIFAQFEPPVLLLNHDSNCDLVEVSHSNQ